MAIKKQEFYEGAALHLVIRAGVQRVVYDEPFFVLDDTVVVHLKYSTKPRSPWAFTFTPDEQILLAKRARKRQPLILGLVCGSDGVAALDFSAYLVIAAPKDFALHVSCHRRHGEHYEVKGPDGTLPRKVPPSMWQKILDQGTQ